MSDNERIAEFMASTPGYVRIDVDARQDWATTLEQLTHLLERENHR